MQDSSAQVQHEPSTSKVGRDQLFYFLQRGISTAEAVDMLISGFCSEVCCDVLTPALWGAMPCKVLQTRS